VLDPRVQLREGGRGEGERQQRIPLLVGRTQEQPRQLDTGFSLRCIPLYEGLPGVSERPGPALSRDADHIHRRAETDEASTAWRSTGPGRWIGAPVVPPVGFEPTLSGV